MNTNTYGKFTTKERPIYQKRIVKPTYNLNVDWSFENIDDEIKGIVNAFELGAKVVQTIAEFLILMRDNEFIDDYKVSFDMGRKCVHVFYSRLSKKHRSYTVSLKDKIIKQDTRNYNVEDSN